MNARTAKIIFLFFMYTGLQVSESCTDCDCADYLPFFDYKSISLTSSGPDIGANQSFAISVIPGPVEFLAQTCPAPRFRFLSAAYGCDCGYNGIEGDKFPFFLNITADKAYNDTLPAGASLNALFFIAAGDVLIQVPEQEAFTFGKPDRPIQLFGAERPTNLNDSYQFKIRLVKTKGDTLQATTGPIHFQ